MLTPDKMDALLQAMWATILAIAYLLAVVNVHDSNPDDIVMTIDSDVCVNASPLLLVTMFSHVGNQRERALVRETYPQGEIAVLGVLRVFVLGRLYGGKETNVSFRSIKDEEVLAEAARERDMIQFDFVEDKDRLSLKSYLASRWALRRCGQATFTAKADDDTFLEYYTIAQMLRDLRTDEQDAIRGELYWFPPTRYFMVGGFYVMPTTALRLLMEASRPLPYTHGDDVYFTGTLADKVGLRRQDVPGIRPWTHGATCCRHPEGRTFSCDRFVFLLDDDTWRRQASAYKEHGKRCYLLRCDKYVPGLKDGIGVQCID